ASPAGPQMIEMALVMVSAPKPPPSRQLISPPGAVLEIEPAKVLHGAVRLHGLASSPTPETHVRVACAFAGTIGRPIARAKPRRPNHILRIFMPRSHCFRLPPCRPIPHFALWSPAENFLRRREPPEKFVDSYGRLIQLPIDRRPAQSLGVGAITT